MTGVLVTGPFFPSQRVHSSRGTATSFTILKHSLVIFPFLWIQIWLRRMFFLLVITTGVLFGNCKATVGTSLPCHTIWRWSRSLTWEASSSAVPRAAGAMLIWQKCVKTIQSLIWGSSISYISSSRADASFCAILKSQHWAQKCLLVWQSNTLPATSPLWVFCFKLEWARRKWRHFYCQCCWVRGTVYALRGAVGKNQCLKYRRPGFLLCSLVYPCRQSRASVCWCCASQNRCPCRCT